MTKDRLLELKSVQVEIRSGLGNGNYAANSSTQEDGKSKKKSSKKMRSSQKSIDDIFKETQQVRAWLEAIEEETKLVKRLHSVVQQSTRLEPEIKDKLINSMIKIKTLSLRIRSSLKTLERQKEDHESPVESRMISVQHSTLFKRFQTAMMDYQAALAHHRDQTAAHIKTQLRIVIQTVTRPAVAVGTGARSPEEMEQLLEAETTQVFVNNYVHETQAMRLALQDAQERHKDMLQLEKSIQELHDLFSDVAAIVHTQGEMINVIEYNVGHGTTNVSQGNEEMAQAYTKKKSARRKKMWCMVVALCVVAICIVYAALHSLITSLFTI